VNFVSHYAVNIVFWDQWDFLTPLFEKQGLWAMFRFQQGPHRQGLGSLLTSITAKLTGWNTRAESFSVAALVIFAMICGFTIKFLIYRSFRLTDIIIPIIFLNLTQYETFIGTPNPAHSAMPLLLSMLYCLAWLIPNYWVRTLSVFTLNFFLLFTGFGIFMGIITIGLFALEILLNMRAHQWDRLVISGLGLLLTALSTWIFFIGYRHNPAVDCFGLSVTTIVKTPIFMAITFARFIRLGFQGVLSVSTIVGPILLAASVFVFVYHTHKLIKTSNHERDASRMIVILTGYTLLFSLSTAIGRSCLGFGSALASRYMTLMIPAFLGLYLHLCSLSQGIRRKAFTGILLIAVSISLLPIGSYDQPIIDWYSIGKNRWKTCYLEYEDIEYCDQTTGFQIYPNAEGTNLDWKLDYLKQNHLNLYLDSQE